MGMETTETEVEMSPAAGMFSPYSSPSTAFLLQRRVLAWAKETGSPATVSVRVAGKSFNLHRDPLASRCRYFSEATTQQEENNSGDAIELPASFPGGSEALEVIALFCYGDDAAVALLDPFNVASVRCAVEFLGARGLLVGRRWDAELVKELAARDLWIKDLVALPLEFFRRIVQALRRQGMKEKYVSPVVLFYANKWVLSKKTHKFWACSGAEDDEAGAGRGESDANRRAAEILQGVVELLPVPAEAAILPAAFYFALLSRSLSLELKEASRARLRDLVASHLRFACVDDLPLPEQEDADRSVADSPEVMEMESIVSNHVAMLQRQGAEAVAELWDRYLVQVVACDPKLRLERLEELIGVVPAADRKTHDHLYEAINTYLTDHPGLCGEEKAALCGHLECRKLSHEACIQAVQNERMPLRFVVQALFVQQLHTQRAFADRSSDSFRCMYASGELLIPGAGGYTPSPGCGPVPTSQPLSATSAYTHTDADAAKLRARGGDDDASDYETASFRIQALEQEIVSLKRTLQRHNTVKGGGGGSVRKDGKEASFRADAAAGRRRGAVSGSCIGSMRWGSQRRCASRILRVFTRLAVFGRSSRSRGKQSKC